MGQTKRKRAAELAWISMRNLVSKFWQFDEWEAILGSGTWQFFNVGAIMRHDEDVSISD